VGQEQVSSSMPMGMTAAAAAARHSSMLHVQHQQKCSNNSNRINRTLPANKQILSHSHQLKGYNSFLYGKLVS
jgi:hypothetical protein